MKVETVFKDVTYDMLNEPEFQEQMAEYWPDLPLLDEWRKIGRNFKSLVSI